MQTRSGKGGERSGSVAPDEACLVGDHDRLDPIPDAELAEDAGHVRLHGGLRDHHLGRDLGVGQAATDQAQDVELALGELGELGREAGRDDWLGEALDEPPGDGRLDQRVARGGGADRGDQARGGRVLEQEACCARAQGAVDVLVLVEGREHDDGRRVGLAQDLFGGGQAVELRHPDVHQHDRRLEERRLADRLETVLGLANHLDVALRLEDHPEAGAHELLVVGDEDADHPSILSMPQPRAGPPQG